MKYTKPITINKKDINKHYLCYNIVLEHDNSKPEPKSTKYIIHMRVDLTYGEYIQTPYEALHLRNVWYSIKNIDVKTEQDFENNNPVGFSDRPIECKIKPYDITKNILERIKKGINSNNNKMEVLFRPDDFLNVTLHDKVIETITEFFGEFVVDYVTDYLNNHKFKDLFSDNDVLTFKPNKG